MIKRNSQEQQHSDTSGKRGGQTDHGHEHGHHQMVADYRRRFWFSLVLTIPILALSPLIQSWLGVEEAWAFTGSKWMLFGLSSAVFVYGGWPFLVGLTREVGRRQPGMMTLISLAIVVAYAYSSAVTFGLEGDVFFWELATLIDVMLLGHWIEMRSVMGASGALEALAKLLPSTAHRLLDNGDIEDVPLSALSPGDRVLVRPGEKVPTDGVIVEGQSSFNESMLTGESKPVDRREGQEAVGGAINGEGAVTLKIIKTGDRTYLSQVMDLVRAAQESRSRTQDLANRAASWLTYLALGVGLTTLVVWLAVGDDYAFAVERMVTVMVITCPHALGLAVPLVVAVSTKLTSQSGLLVRDRAAFERARDLNAVIFDKTGTLTEGEFGVTDVATTADLTEEKLLGIAAAVESQSEHPIAKGVVRSAKEKDLVLPKVSGFRAITGKGAEATVDGHSVKIVSPSFLKEQGIEGDELTARFESTSGKTIVHVIIDDEHVGAIALADVIREESFETVRRLKEMGVRPMMLTGDSAEAAAAVSEALGLDEYFAEVRPEQKAAKVIEVQRRGDRVAMVGDGINDAPALATADLGIAIGAGTDVAIESADVVLVRSNPRDVFAILAFSRATYSKMIQNLLWATGYNAIAIPLAAGVAYSWGIVLSPAVGAALMSLSTVIVAVNAKLLERARSLVPSQSG